jgi:hypothetical protein
MAAYAIGDRVAHSQYGDGTITRVDEYHTVIDFDVHGSRTFSSPRVVLTASNTEAPAKPAARRRKRPAKVATVAPEPEATPEP